jgi:hypothetical protein
MKLRIVGLCDGTPTAFDGKYLVDYDPTRPGVDPEGHEMIAHIEVTADPAQAREFRDAREALECWRRSHGMRQDGMPNRPLTAFTVEVAA